MALGWPLLIRVYLCRNTIVKECLQPMSVFCDYDTG
jgi:hypothetical protein